MTPARRPASSLRRRRWWTRWFAFSNRAQATRSMTRPPDAAACWFMLRITCASTVSTPTSARYFAQEMNWGNAAIGKINSVLHGLEADIKAGASTITDPEFLEDGQGQEVLAGARQFPVFR